MHYEPTDIAAMARTSNLNEELGQVEKNYWLQLCMWNSTCGFTI